MIRLGFFNSDTAAPTAGCWLEANYALSANWRAIVLNSLSNGGNARIIDTGIAINRSGNKDFQLAIAYDGLAWSANFLLSGTSAIVLPGVPVASGQELFFSASVLKTAGSTNNSISLDHMGGGIRQLL